MPYTSIIIKTHNSESTIDEAIHSVKAQGTSVNHLVIVDSGSKNSSHLAPYSQTPQIELLIIKEDIGFCLGNNLGVEKVWTHSDYIVFQNPDAFLTPDLIQKAVQFMEQPENKDVAILTAALHGFDLKKHLPSGLFDSTGIFRTWYGKWGDRHQGVPISEVTLNQPEEVDAICGAFMFCRKSALQTVLLREREVFDNSFYLYKEDIDLSCRLKKQGWKLMLDPTLIVYHGRGWSKNRKEMSRKFRLLSARNELKMHARQLTPCMLYSLAKYLAVKCFNF